MGVIAGAHDGKVSVSESRFEHQDDHEVVPSAHTFIMTRADTRELTKTFLETGAF